MISNLGGEWITVALILVFLFGLFLGARLPFGRSSRAVRKEPRQSPHYIRGMYAMLTGDVENAIDHLSKVVELSTEPIEVYLTLGNLYRQRGQIDRAIRVHQSLLTRSNLSEEERVLALNALGMDFRTGGLMDRAMKTFRESLGLSPKDPDALAHLVKLSEDLGEWSDAYDFAVRLQKVRRHKDPRMLSYLLAQKAQALADNGLHVQAAWQLKKAIRLFRENMPAYVFLTRLYLKVNKADRAKRTVDRALKQMPHKAFMIMDLIKDIYVQKDDPAGYLDSLHVLGHKNHQKRALLQEIREFSDLKRTEQIPPIVKELVRHYGRSRLVQRTLWDLYRKQVIGADLVNELAETLANSEQMMDPFTCIYCGYRTLEILYRCPNCKDWNSFSDGEG